jgi:hypothetical protein
VAEISLDHTLIARDLRWTALRYDAAFRENENLFRQTHHRLRHVLDHHNGDATGA